MKRWWTWVLIGIGGLLIGCQRGAPSPFLRPSSVLPTPVPSPSPMAPSPRCALPFRPHRALPAVDLSALSWAEMPLIGHSVRLLGSSPRPLLPLTISPDGRWLVVVFPRDEVDGSAEVALVALHGAARRWLNRQVDLLSPYVAASALPLAAWTRWRGLPWTVSWLADGSVLWLDEAGQIWRDTGVETQSVSAPAPVDWIEVQATGQGLARGDPSGLWRVDVMRGRWEPVGPEAVQQSALGGWGPGGAWFLVWTSRPSDAPPGPTLPGATWTELTFWRVPLAEGQPAHRLGRVTLPLVGTDAWMPPSQRLAAGRWWVLGLPLAGAGVGALVDTEEGQWRDAPALGLPPGGRMVGIQASPQGGWVMVAGQRPEDREGQGMLRLWDGNLTASIWSGEGVGVVAWHPEDEAVVLGEGGFGPPDTLAPLAVLRLPPTEAPRRLEGAGWPVAFTREWVVAQDRAHPARVLAFDLDGNQRDALDLSRQVERVCTMLGAGDAVYLDVGWAEGDECRYGLVEWRPR